MRDLLRAIAGVLAVEQDRLFLWLPVAFGAGIALYFWLPVEPRLLVVAIGASLAYAQTRIWRRGLASLVLGGAVAAIALGLAAAKLASDLSAAPVIEPGFRSGLVTGWVELIEPRVEGGERITLRVHAIEGLAPEATPRRVRVRVPAGAPALAPGDAVSLPASLLPPAGPALPGAYDFARTAWFLGLGGVGSSRKRPELTTIPAPIPWPLAAWAPVERLRQSISRRITAALPGVDGAIAAALITGERGGIPDAINAQYRDSGIFHILSISGLHMTIFAGALYATARFLLALVPALALRFDIKKWAAVIGLAGTAGYLLISGGSPAAVRSALMLSIMFAAVLLDRPALALRNVALAALVILALSPSSFIDVGFQMSFAAVVALTSAAEAWRTWRERRLGRDQRDAASLPMRLFLFLAAITATTLVATVSVAPFAAYYFHKSNQYGIIANAIAVPICNVVVMPAALATLIAMPFGLEALPLWVMGQGIEAMNAVAAQVAALPGAVSLVPAISETAFALMIAGGLWLCLWATRWRLLGLLPIAAGLALAPARELPDVIVGAGGALVAVRATDGRLAAIDAGRSAFELGRWLEHEADPRPVAEVGPGITIACDDLACAANPKNSERPTAIAVVRHPAALAEDCRRTALLIWLGRGDPHCPAASRPRIITQDQVTRDGAHAIYLAGEAPRIETIALWRGQRPWSHPGSRPRFLRRR